MGTNLKPELQAALEQFCAQTKGEPRRVQSVISLLEGLSINDRQLIDHALQLLTDDASEGLFEQVGKLTRRLHSSLVEFKGAEVNSRIAEIANGAVPDATDKLNAVIAMTDQAAHKVLQLVEKQTDVLDKERESIQTTLNKLSNGERPSDPAGWQAVMSTMAGEVLHANTSLQSLSTEILMAQEFQDLSGQTLKKVIKLLVDVEDGLVELVKMFGVSYSTPEVQEPEPVELQGPDAKQSCNQDDVDALLCSLGF
jgi:chemotaxis protein CheZ